MIGLGFADTREEVEEMINLVDDDGSGQIEFKEFLTIIEMSSDNAEGHESIKEKIGKINQFFKDMSNGKFGDEGLSFPLIV